MNDIEDEPVPSSNIFSPQASPGEPVSADAIENSISQNDAITHSDSHRRPFNCLFFTFKVIYYIYIFFKWCCGGLARFFCKNKIIAFMTLQMFFGFLKLINVIKEKTLFWLVLTSIFIILFIMIVYLCIAADNSSPRIHIQRSRNIQYQNYQRSLNARRAYALNVINDRLLEQIFLNSPPSRVNFFVTGPAGGMRLMHLEHDLQDINGTRAQIRMISRGLMRLLAEFIEEQQLHQNRNQRNGLTEEQINALPLEKFVPPIIVGPEEAETCSICIDEFKGEQDLRRLPCNHRFHQNCIDEWLKISSCCPNCKADIVPDRAQAPAAQEP